MINFYQNILFFVLLIILLVLAALCVATTSLALSNIAPKSVKGGEFDMGERGKVRSFLVQYGIDPNSPVYYMLDRKFNNFEDVVSYFEQLSDATITEFIVNYPTEHRPLNISSGHMKDFLKYHPTAANNEHNLLSKDWVCNLCNTENNRNNKYCEKCHSGDPKDPNYFKINYGNEIEDDDILRSGQPKIIDMRARQMQSDNTNLLNPPPKNSLSGQPKIIDMRARQMQSDNTDLLNPGFINIPPPENSLSGQKASVSLAPLENTWPCPYCSFINSNRDNICKVCNKSKNYFEDSSSGQKASVSSASSANTWTCPGCTLINNNDSNPQYCSACYTINPKFL